jgi:hypothetical protein
MQETIEKTEVKYTHDDKIATEKDLKILRLEINNDMGKLKSEINIDFSKFRVEIFSVIDTLKLDMEKRFNSMTTKLGSLIIASSGILFGLLSYFHK